MLRDVLARKEEGSEDGASRDAAERERAQRDGACSSAARMDPGRVRIKPKCYTVLDSVVNNSATRLHFLACLRAGSIKTALFSTQPTQRLDTTQKDEID